MLEFVWWPFSTLSWAMARCVRAEVDSMTAFAEAGTLVAGALAGGVGRAAVLPLDRGGAKGATQAVWRRMPQFGLLMMFYCHLAPPTLPRLGDTPRTKMATTFLLAACAGYNMRLLCNPITRVADECLRTGQRPGAVVRALRSKTILQFWYTGPNLCANALYCGVLLTVFEGLRRYTERNVLPYRYYKSMYDQHNTNDSSGSYTSATTTAVLLPDGGGGGVATATAATPTAVAALASTPQQQQQRRRALHVYTTTILLHGVLGGASAAVASTLCYPYSAHCYLQTVIHDSAICRGLAPTLRKEVPMMAVTFAAFAALQPLFAPWHSPRSGFGY